MLTLKKHEANIRAAIDRWAYHLGFDEGMTAAIADAVFATRQELSGILSGQAGRPADHEAFVPSHKSEKLLGKYTGAKK